MSATRGRVRVHQGVVYFHPTDAREIEPELRRLLGREFPEMRRVEYGRGTAFQIRKSGDYLGPDLRPTMETAMRRFDRA